jgi:MoxR-like ATPase
MAKHIANRKAAVAGVRPVSEGFDEVIHVGDFAVEVPVTVDPWFGEEKPLVISEFTDSKLTSLQELVGSSCDLGAYGSFKVNVFKDEDYSEQDRKMIPSLAKFTNYTVNAEVLYKLAFAIETGYQPVIAVTGLPSTGKSTIVEYLSALTRRPFFPFSPGPQYDVGHLIGVKEVKDGETQFNPGIITKALTTPNAVLMHDEAFTMDPGTAICMQRVLQKDGDLMLPEMDDEDPAKRYVIPHPNVIQVMTDNTEGNGDTTGKFTATQPQNSAFLDRIDMFIKMDFMTPAEECDALRKYFPEATDRLLSDCTEVAKLARTAYVNGTVSNIMSFRVLQSWVRTATNLRNVRQALQLCMLNRMSDASEEATIMGFVDTVFGPEA